MRKLLFSGELPPRSMHGVSNSNQVNLDMLKSQFKIYIDEEYVNLKYHGKQDFRKFSNFAGRFFRILRLALLNRFAYFYIVFSTSTIGALKTVILVKLFSMFNNGKIIIHIHRGDLVPFLKRKKLNEKLFRELLKNTFKLIVLSSRIEQEIKEMFKPSVPMLVLENTVLSELDLNSDLKQSSSDLKFIYISNYIEDKGIMLLLEAFKGLPGNHRLECFGNFTDLALKSRIYGFRSERIVINEGITGEEKFRKIYEADALILPSLNEGKPLVLLEAMSVGTPFISSDVGYISEMPYEGYPYLYRSHADLKHVISKFIADPDKKNVGVKLKNHFCQTFSVDNHKKALLDIFK